MPDQAIVDPSQREEKVAAREMAARLNVDPAAVLRQRLSRRDILQRRRQLVEDPARRGAAQKRKAACSGVLGPESFLVGRQRLAGAAAIEQDVTLQQQRRPTAIRRRGQRQPTLDQRQRFGGTVALQAVLGRQTVSVDRGRGLGAIEMRRAQHRIAAIEPVGGAGVQPAPRLGEQRAQNRLADQRMGENQLCSVDAQKAAPKQAGRVIGRIADHRLKRRRIEALSQHCRGANRDPVRRSQAINARYDQPAQRERQIAGRFRNIAQELFEKQRVAAGALDALAQGRLGQARQMADHRLDVLLTKRAQIDRGQQYARGLDAQRFVKPLVLGPGGQRQNQWSLDGDRRQSQQPVHVLDDEQQRRVRQPLHQQRERLVAARAPGRLVRGVDQAAQRRRQGSFGQLMQEGLQSLFDGLGRDEREHCGRPRVGRGFRHQAQQAVGQSPQRIALVAGAEVEHVADVARDSAPGRLQPGFLRQPALADPWLAAHIHDPARAGGQAAVQ